MHTAPNPPCYPTSPAAPALQPNPHREHHRDSVAIGPRPFCSFVAAGSTQLDLMPLDLQPLARPPQTYTPPRILLLLSHFLLSSIADRLQACHEALPVKTWLDAGVVSLDSADVWTSLWYTLYDTELEKFI